MTSPRPLYHGHLFQLLHIPSRNLVYLWGRYLLRFPLNVYQWTKLWEPRTPASIKLNCWDWEWHHLSQHNLAVGFRKSLPRRWDNKLINNFTIYFWNFLRRNLSMQNHLHLSKQLWQIIYWDSHQNSHLTVPKYYMNFAQS